jgi:hypothetical protein
MSQSVTESEEDEYFMSDRNLYFLWRFSKDEFLPQDDIVHFHEVIPSDYEAKEYFELLWEYSDIDARYELSLYGDSEYPARLPKTEEELESYDPKARKEVLRICDDIRKGKILASDIHYASAITRNLTIDLRFKKKEGTDRGDPKIREELDSYIEKFLGWDLLIERQNYYNFEKQKELLIKSVREMKAFEDFGKNFILSDDYGPMVVFTSDKKKVLFIHTLYALEFLGYLRVLEIWFKKSDSGHVFFANIAPNESFKAEVYQDFRKENPKTVVEGFDPKTGTLKFAGQDIGLSKGKKQTDAVLLVGTLMKIEDDEWMHNDEILEDWGYREEEQENVAKNKVYFAAQKVNTAIALQVSGVHDFLDANTSKVRINPKYRKVDK